MHLVGSDIKRNPGVKRKSLLGQVVLVLLGVQLAFFGSFTCFELPIGTGSNLTKFAKNETRNLALMMPDQVQEKIKQYAPAVYEAPQQVRYSTYVPLAPTAILIGYVLGPRLALWAVGAFLLLGLAGPMLGIYPLASGGGANYYLEPGFGYLLGMLGAAGLCGWITKSRRTSLTQVVGVAAGIIALHASGCAYLILTYLFFYVFEGSKTYLEWQPWIFQYLRNLSWYALPYDILLALGAVGVAFPARWLVNTLTATDAAPPPKKVKYDRRTLEELVGN